jgi:hypothetical protein
MNMADPNVVGGAILVSLQEFVSQEVGRCRCRPPILD